MARPAQPGRANQRNRCPGLRRACIVSELINSWSTVP